MICSVCKATYGPTTELPSHGYCRRCFSLAMAATELSKDEREGVGAAVLYEDQRHKTELVLGGLLYLWEIPARVIPGGIAVPGEFAYVVTGLDEFEGLSDISVVLVVDGQGHLQASGVGIGTLPDLVERMGQ